MKQYLEARQTIKNQIEMIEEECEESTEIIRVGLKLINMHGWQISDPNLQLKSDN
jgi:hypothetical protein